MSKVEHDAIIMAITQLAENNKQSHDDIRNLIESSHETIKAELATEMKGVAASITSLDKTIKEHNARLKKSEELIEKGKTKMVNYDQVLSELHKVKKNWIFLILGGIMFVAFVTFLYDVGAIGDLIQKIFDKI